MEKLTRKRKIWLYRYFTIEMIRIQEQMNNLLSVYEQLDDEEMEYENMFCDLKYTYKQIKNIREYIINEL